MPIKSCTLFVIILLFSFQGHAQIEKGAIYFGARAGYLSIEDYAPRTYGGLELDVMVTDKIGIHYSILFGEEYFHMPLAPVGGFFVAAAVSDIDEGFGFGLLLGAITAIIPEGVSYNIPLGENSGFAPYISPLQFEYVPSGEGNTYPGGAIGLRYHQYVGKKLFRVSPMVEYKVHYNKNPHLGISAGLNIALQLKEKSAKLAVE